MRILGRRMKEMRTTRARIMEMTQGRWRGGNGRDRDGQGEGIAAAARATVDFLCAAEARGESGDDDDCQSPLHSPQRLSSTSK
jgi:hypothetical protein